MPPETRTAIYSSSLTEIIKHYIWQISSNYHYNYNDSYCSPTYQINFSYCKKKNKKVLEIE